MNARGKSVDTTFLNLDLAEKRGFIHRDYLSHCLRWSHVVKHLYQKNRYREAVILDVGCGRRLPLPKTLYSSRLQVRQYYGVDAGPIDDDAMEVFHTGRFPIKVWENCDVLEITAEDLQNTRPSLVTCFECLEHVEPLHMLRMLRHIRQLMDPKGTAFFSTPCWNVTDCADSHVNEMRYEALGAVFESHGWIVRNVWGTFASIRDYEHKLSPVEKELFDKLREYYDSNYLSTIFAPLHPAESRNCLWELSPYQIVPGTIDESLRRFKPLAEVLTPWGSSALWEQMATAHDQLGK